MKRTAQWYAAIFCVTFGTLFADGFSVSARSAAVVPNDQHQGEQTYLQQIHADEAWSLSTGSARILIAVIDSGLDSDHPDLHEVVWTNPDEVPGDGIDNDKNGYVDDVSGWDFINNIPDPNPKFGGNFTIAGIHHGTLLAGIIAARGNNGIGASGISWRSRIMPLRVLNNEGDGNVFSVVEAIDYAIAKDVDIINLSFTSDTDSSFLRAAIQRAVRAGIPVVIAAGNDDTTAHAFDLAEHPVYPACTEFAEEGVITVGATDSLGQKAAFSPYGPCIDIMAPGTDIYSTQVVQYERVGFDSFYGGGWSGTSLSTAMVTGTIALMKSVNSLLTPREIAVMIRTHCDSVDALNPAYKGKLGCGQLNVAKLVQATIDKARNPNPFERELPEKLAHIVVAPADGSAIFATYTGAGEKKNLDHPTFFPYAPYRVPYTMNTTRDGRRVFAAGPGGGAHIRVFDHDGALLHQFFAYDNRWRIGVVAAVGDVDGDGEEEIVTAPASRGGGHIKIFTLSGVLKGNFFAYPKNIRTGYALALGDLNNDGKHEIILSAHGARDGEIKIFSGAGTPFTQFVAYPNSTITEVVLAVGDTNNDGEEEIVVAPARGAAPLTIFSSIGAFKRAVFPFGSSYNRGIALAIGDLNGDRRNEIIAVPATNAPAHVMVLNGNGETVGTFFASEKRARTGFVVSILFPSIVITS